jgi:hypothetical protein
MASQAFLAFLSLLLFLPVHREDMSHVEDPLSRHLPLFTTASPWVFRLPCFLSRRQVYLSYTLSPSLPYGPAIYIRPWTSCLLVGSLCSFMAFQIDHLQAYYQYLFGRRSQGPLIISAGRNDGMDTRCLRK